MRFVLRLLLNCYYYTAGYWVGWKTRDRHARQEQNPAAVRVIMYAPRIAPGSNKIHDRILIPDRNGEIWIDLGDEIYTYAQVQRIGIIQP